MKTKNKKMRLTSTKMILIYIIIAYCIIVSLRQPAFFKPGNPDHALPCRYFYHVFCIM